MPGINESSTMSGAPSGGRLGVSGFPWLERRAHLLELLAEGLCSEGDNSGTPDRDGGALPGTGGEPRGDTSSGASQGGAPSPRS